MTNSNPLVAKLWNFCNVLRDDGVSTIEYVEQLTYLLFLKMADERKASSPSSPTRCPPTRSDRPPRPRQVEGSRPMKATSLVWGSASAGTSTLGPYWPLARSISSRGSMPSR